MDARNEPQPAAAYRVVIVDDHPLFRAALKSAVCAACATGEFFEADSVAAMLDTLERHPGVDLLLLDLNLPGAHGFSALAYLRGAYPSCRSSSCRPWTIPLPYNRPWRSARRGFSRSPPVPTRSAPACARCYAAMS